MKKFALAAAAALALAALILFHPLAPSAAPAAWSSGELRDVTVTHRPRTGGTDTARPAGTVVYVAGEVVHPGLYTLPMGSRAADALQRAGGAKPDADLVAVNLAARVNDGDEVAVPVIGAAHPRSRRALGPHARRARHGRASGRRNVHAGTQTASNGAASATFAILDLNAADTVQLAAVPGIGPAIAQRIVDYRSMNGPFASTGELLDVSGITPARLASLEGYVEVQSSRVSSAAGN